MSQRTTAVSHVISHAGPRHVAAPARSCRRASRPCRSFLAAVSWPVSQHTQQPGHARRQCAQAGRVPCLLAMSWGRVTGLMVVSWPPCCTPLSPLSRYNALYRDQVQKWVVAQPDFLHYFFFFRIFFSHSNY